MDIGMWNASRVCACQQIQLFWETYEKHLCHVHRYRHHPSRGQYEFKSSMREKDTTIARTPAPTTRSVTSGSVKAYNGPMKQGRKRKKLERPHPIARLRQVWRRKVTTRNSSDIPRREVENVIAENEGTTISKISVEIEQPNMALAEITDKGNGMTQVMNDDPNMATLGRSSLNLNVPWQEGGSSSLRSLD